ncbi:MAG TPA: asparagine synthase-related protein, partial [Steroidobacteraceae bacterium]|nr:asparagine synthase-related protein [Steroidobacteraceae bacterium]
FMRDKWVIRRIADRYLPKALSQRKKLPFSVSAFHRMQIAREYFDNSFVAESFKLDRVPGDGVRAAGARRYPAG